MANAPAFLELFFACAKMDTLTVPVGVQLTVPETAHLLADAGSWVFVASVRLIAGDPDICSNGNSTGTES